MFSVGRLLSCERQLPGLDRQLGAGVQTARTGFRRVKRGGRLLVGIEVAGPFAHLSPRQVDANAQERERVQSGVEMIAVLSESRVVGLDGPLELRGPERLELRLCTGLSFQSLQPPRLDIARLQRVRLGDVP